jgi:hypothetical protein
VIIVPSETEKPPAADIEIRNAAYTALLELLTLAPDHLRNLAERGLSETAIQNCGYKTTPIIGERLLAKRITDAGIPLHGVPGFYRDKTEVWPFVTLRRGILIPVRNIHGRIQGMPIRCDNVSRRKYRWFFSVNSYQIADNRYRARRGTKDGCLNASFVISATVICYLITVI